ncbi:MAG: nucleoside-diphosphate kinase [Candidatus Thermoplasmatota archaeon]|jgi:nucleoside-diphosphate kinase|nr:nucleoside-diphosphate kinase [Candidatus Thermoplasmatota archaeon]
MERTLILIKPDGVKRRLVGEIIGRMERKGLKLVSAKMLVMTSSMAEKHYEIHKTKPFYRDLVKYITSGPIFAAVLEGNNVIQVVRLMAGTTDGSKAQPGTIRGDFATGIERNIIHASDSTEAYNHEYPIFFSREEMLDFRYGDEDIV